MDVWYLTEYTKKLSNDYKVKYFEGSEDDYDRCIVQCMVVNCKDVVVSLDDGDLSFVETSATTLTVGDLRAYISANTVDEETDVIFIDGNSYSDIHSFNVNEDSKEIILF